MSEPLKCQSCKEREATVTIQALGPALCRTCLDEIDTAITRKNANKDGQLSALRYILTVIESRKSRNSTSDYLAGLDDVKLSVEAAIERIEQGGDMESHAYTQSNPAETCEEPSQNS